MTNRISDWCRRVILNTIKRSLTNSINIFNINFNSYFMMTKRQLRAIVNYSYAYFGTICADVLFVADSIELAAARNKCRIADVVNAFVDFDKIKTYKLIGVKHGEKLVDTIIGIYLYSKAAEQ